MQSALSRRLAERARLRFHSYAQRGEDAILWRALRDLEHGFYVDVGAQSPDVDSVTRAFYERGWSGINIEPVAAWFAQLAARRPRDLNINAACAAQAGSLELYELAGTGLSTVRKEYAQRHVRELGHKCRRISVPCLRLDSLPLPRAFQFLKIDVEGAERAVLQGVDLARYRPWIILVEATEPNSEVPSHAGWDELVTGRGYGFALFDGLNRYYVADECAGLGKLLAAG